MENDEMILPENGNIENDEVGFDELIDNYQHTVDAKGRVFLPVEYRAVLGTSAWVTCGMDGCLFAFTQKQWTEFKDKIAALPLATARNMQRFFISNAKKCELDAQGRISIPQALRTFANITRDVTIAGVSKRFEIWDRERWQQLNGSITNDMIVEALDFSGI